MCRHARPVKLYIAAAGRRLPGPRREVAASASATSALPAALFSTSRSISSPHAFKMSVRDPSAASFELVLQNIGRIAQAVAGGRSPAQQQVREAAIKLLGARWYCAKQCSPGAARSFVVGRGKQFGQPTRLLACRGAGRRGLWQAWQQDHGPLPPRCDGTGGTAARRRRRLPVCYLCSSTLLRHCPAACKTSSHDRLTLAQTHTHTLARCLRACSCSACCAARWRCKCPRWQSPRLAACTSWWRMPTCKAKQAAAGG